MRVTYFKFLLERPKIFIFEIYDIFLVVIFWVFCVFLSSIANLPDHFELLLTVLFALVYLPLRRFVKPNTLFFKLTKNKSNKVTIKSDEV